MAQRVRVGVLISGRGSNLQALIDACARPDFPAEIALVLSNRPGAGGLARAAEAGIGCETVDHKNYPDRESFERAVDERLKAAGIELVCLAGFMRILTPWFVTAWDGRLLNIHPSLLPAFPGVDTHARALAAGVAFAGCTVHRVTASLDDGPILAQGIAPVAADDTPETLATRVLRLEHVCYPAALDIAARVLRNASSGGRAAFMLAGTGEQDMPFAL